MSHKSNKDKKESSKSSKSSRSFNEEGNEYIEEDPQHHHQEQYNFLSEDANQIVHKDKRFVKYIFDQSAFAGSSN